MRSFPNLIKMSLIFGFVLILYGCQSVEKPEVPTSPTLHPSGQSTTNSGDRHILGFWEIAITSDHTSATALPLRGAEMHFNMVHILETTCVDCLIIENLIPLPDGTLSADLRIKHPFPGLAQFTGFDVRGILVTGSDYEFPASGRKISWGDQNPRLLNADGYTSLFNPTDFPENPNVPFILRYTKGKYASDTVDLTSTLNPYLAYSEDQPRRIFLSGTAQTQTAILELPAGPIRFGYVVDASWFPVDGDIIDPITDFPPEANSLEAYKININSVLELGPYAGNALPIEVEIWDHQGPETISTVTLESPEIFNGEVALSFGAVSPDNTAIYTGLLKNELGAGPGEYPLLVRVADSQTDPNLGPVDAWQVQALKVESHGWTLTWGGSNYDYGQGVAVDGSGDVNVTGYFTETVDFDPGPGIDNRTSSGSEDIFLSRFDSSGNVQWAKTWGRDSSDEGFGIAVDSSGNVYVSGWFWGLIDFDPGPGDDFHTSNGDYDIFLSKFDSTGNFLWAKTWGGIGWDEGHGVAVDLLGNVYVTGWFWGLVDFDPAAAGTDSHNSKGFDDVFLSVFDSDGNFIRAITWGGSNTDYGLGLAVDDSGNAYVTGIFKDIVDFDPGPSVDEHSSNGDYDIFLSRFDWSGNFLWSKAWGGSDLDKGLGVAVDGSESVYVTGYFSETVDFDPAAAGEDNHISSGSYDVFLSRFDPSGNFLWAKTWGGSSLDRGYGVAVDGSGNPHVTGYFSDIVDFDPAAAGVDNHTSNGEYDIFLSRLDSSGNFQWSKTWGGISADVGFGVTVDGSGNVYVAGNFRETVDFDPGPGIDTRTSAGSDDVFLSKFEL